MPKSQRPKRALSAPEVRALIAAAHPGLHRAVIKLIVYHGLRSNEARSLDVGDVNRLLRTLHVRFAKGGKQRILRLHAACVADLNQIQTDRAASEPLLSTCRGRISNTTIRRLVRETARRAGLPETWTHALRRTFATALKDGQVDLKTIQELLGHENLATTAIYLSTTEQQKADAIDGLEF